MLARPADQVGDIVDEIVGETDLRYKTAHLAERFAIDHRIQAKILEPRIAERCPWRRTISRF